MKLYVGTKNPVKLAAVEHVFSEHEIISVEVSSKVSSQPFSDKETREGAINRAMECAALSMGGLGIGLEGGVMEIKESLYLCNWGALVDEKDTVYTASGARIPLPDEIWDELKKGIELGDVMEAYAKKKDVRKKEGAIGIFTNEMVTRETMFAHVIKLLKGQYEVKKNKA
ncbi:DUF84 family protein [Aquibacillus sp. 3ASR75-11]|uniref:inosine/xanthosine triphosphatase n=1 Tax=Terrihalobacillus insolitus TaxID=2950438 RepID=A0A9X3WX01_9BACI|nr:DUF84 family protein [Terrihalobacillus insolitus]MDC3415081.1 DUF84 family protein [Terrihalobacillus insolitus]MDC3426078.1 DUF84 family protein [Terrihalobacillus insolitus]